MLIDVVIEILSEAVRLHIEKEQVFVSLSEMLAAAMSWEKRAKQILASDSKLKEFENVLRTSEDIIVILPSLPAVIDAVSAAESWLESSKPFVQPRNLTSSASNCMLVLEELKVCLCPPSITLIRLIAPELIAD